MYQLFYWPTPNGHKITLALEEMGLPYTLQPVDIGRGDQFDPDYLRLSPSGKMPALIDSTPADGQAPLSLFESGAILLYLAQRHQQLWPSAPAEQVQCLSWLFWQVSAFGPMCGQNAHFRRYAPMPVPYAQERYAREVRRLYGVLDTRLQQQRFLAGSYSIADIACHPWVHCHQPQGIDLAEFPAVARWFAEIGARPAVQRAYQRGEGLGGDLAQLSGDAWRRLFANEGQALECPL
jgi:GST-like protein